MFYEIVLTGLPIDRDDVEHALEAAFAPDGEVTGAGTGIAPPLVGVCHLDLEIERDPDPDLSLNRIWGVLAELGIDAYTKVNVSD